jgi:hypothetical protein
VFEEWKKNGYDLKEACKTVGVGTGHSLRMTQSIGWGLLKKEWIAEMAKKFDWDEERVIRELEKDIAAGDPANSGNLLEREMAPRIAARSKALVDGIGRHLEMFTDKHKVESTEMSKIEIIMGDKEEPVGGKDDKAPLLSEENPSV